MRILRRLTLVHSDPSQNHRIKDLIAAFDILAIRPTTMESLKQACVDLDCDIISINLTQRFGTHLSHFKLLSRAISRGIKLELCYAPGILTTDAYARRMLISNTIQLLRATRGRGIIISSECEKPIGCRSPWDVINLATVWGLSQERGREALTTEPRSVVVNAGLKRTSYRGAVDVIYGGKQPGRKSKSEAADQVKRGDERGKGKEKEKENGQAKTENNQSPDTNSKKRKLVADRKDIQAQPEPPAENSPEPKLSNREMKRRAKKARYEAEKAASVAKEPSGKDGSDRVEPVKVDSGGG